MTASTEIEELRELLHIVEREQIDLLEFRIHQLEQEIQRLTQNQQFKTEFVADVLPEAIGQRGETDKTFTTSVKPHVVQAINLLSRNDPDEMASALYPVLGPAIRKMVANYFTLDRPTSTFTPEQVFLIEPGSGLVVRHVSTDTPLDSSVDTSGEVDVISGMLEAIRSFVQDSFDVDDHDGMRELTVGDITVMVEWGPTAILACVTRGVGSNNYRTVVQQTLEKIHSEFGNELENYQGDTETTTNLEPALKSLLEYDPVQRRTRPHVSSRPTSIWFVLVISILVSFLVFLMGL